MDAMKKEIQDIDLLNDQAILNQLIDKDSWNKCIQEQIVVPNHYFDQFPGVVLKAIQNEKKETKIIQIGFIRKIAIAASILAVVATSYLLVQKNLIVDNENIVVSIQEIPNEEIETYVTTHEWYAELDETTEMNEMVDEIEVETYTIPNDTISKQFN